MKLLYTHKDAFEKVKRFLEENQYLFTYEIINGQYKITIQD